MKSLRRGSGLLGLFALEVVENLCCVGVESDRSECRPLISRKLEPNELANVDASQIAELIPDFKLELGVEQLGLFFFC